MAAATSEQRFESIEDLEYIVDSDSHLTERLDDFLPYLDPQYEGVKELIELSNFPMSDVFSITAPTPIFPIVNDDSQEDPDIDLWGGGDTQEGKLELMEKYDIDYSIINPTIAALMNTVTNSRFAVALVNAYNSYLVDKFGDNDRLRLNIIVPPHDPQRGAEEINTWRSEDYVAGVLIPTAGLLPAPGDRRYDPIYNAAQKAELPIVFHSNTGGVHRSFPMQHNWTETYAEEHAIMHPFTHMWHLTSLVFNGTVERFPDLNFVFNEAGIGWVPYMKWRLDDHYLELPHDVPVLEKLPSEYINERFYFSTQPLGHTADNPKHIAQMIKMIGPDRIMYSADIPHPDFDPPHELFDRINSSLDKRAVQQIMGGTAKELYGIE